MTIVEIYEKFRPGSDAFSDAVHAHCGYSMTFEEIKRLGEATKHWEDFEDQLENDDWWQDNKQ